MSAAASTRGQQWSNWKGVVTIAIAHGTVSSLLPMSPKFHQALTWQLILLGCGPAHLKAIWAAIVQRHRQHELTPPMTRSGDYSRWVKAISRMMGQPKLLKFPLGKPLVHRLLQMDGVTEAPYVVQRNVLATVLGVLCCARVSEIAALQACDVLYNLDTLRGDAQYAGTAAIHICKRKNDALRKGLFPRLGRARSSIPAFNVVQWLWSFQHRFGQFKHPGCTRTGSARPSSR